MHDVIIIGGGHNGLVAACYLAKAGLKPLVLERREQVGGSVVTEEIHPGFRCSTLAHTTGPFSQKIAAHLDLASHGVEWINPPARLTVLNPDGPSPTIYDDATRTAESLKQVSAADAASFADFTTSFARIGRVLAPLLSMTPPTIEKPAAGELWNLGKLGLSFRGLGKQDAFRLLRWGPMAVADLAAEWFETESLRAAVAARGIYGAFAGPWSAGTSTGLLMQAARDGHATASATSVKGGLGAITQALAKVALERGVEIRTSAEVIGINRNGEQAPSVVLANGDQLKARAVVSNADPRTTFLKLVDPVDLDPNFLLKLQNYRAVGCVAKINLALSGLPAFTGLNGNERERLSGRIQVGHEIDYLERAFDAAKYGNYSEQPYLDIAIPSLNDPSLAPAGAHVMSIHVQYAPYKLKQGDWISRKEEFADAIIDGLAGYAPGLKDLILQCQTITPVDLEQTYGLAGGHIFHGEQSLDQFFMFRPLIGWAQYRTPIKGLFLCGAGTHPGGEITGQPGANAAREVIQDFRKKKI
ncbi:MAG TPA: NAD(P)/FAD-dependent oxidoreductase [Pyrinomonadaceae bacterium]|nr:NAD(P)/FAD-dependent oxidoreductase [Pyrinomonadaceae bacterium]